MLIDGEINGQKRKLLAQASRNGYFFVLDRTNGQEHRDHEVRQNELGERPGCERASRSRIRRRSRRSTARWCRPIRRGAANWPPPSFSPADRSVLRQCHRRIQRLLHLRRRRQARRLGRQRSRRLVANPTLQAIDYKTGKIKWSHKWEGTGGPRSGVLSTAGNLVFAGDPHNNFVAFNATTGQPLWNVNLGSGMSNSPITYELDGTQYVVVGAGDSMFGFAMLPKR